MNDVIIVGSGISGCNLYWELLKRHKRVQLISNNKLASSSVAAGVYNPTILKRFTPVWNGGVQIDSMLPHYRYIEGQLNTTLLHSMPVWRRLHDSNEVKTWLKKAERDDLKRFMSRELVQSQITGIDAAYGFGLVQETGWLDTIKFMDLTIAHARSSNCFSKETFNYDDLAFKEGVVNYNETKARHIIFADGFGLLKNPLFNRLPMQGNKGEVITIKVPGLQLNSIIKSSVFLMPYKNDLFWVGATYDRDDLSYQPTKNGLEFLTSRLERFLKLPYEIIDHKAGIRPTTIDRRPFLGAHPEHSRALVLNGMGSRAVLIAPWAVMKLCDFIYNETPLPDEISITRFN